MFLGRARAYRRPKVETRQTKRSRNRGNKAEPGEAAERERQNHKNNKGPRSGRYQCDGDSSNDQQAGTT